MDLKYDEEEGESNIEETHCTIDKVYAFNIPKLAGASTGHSARDWPKQAFWSGRLRVVSKGQKCTVLLEHVDKDGLFAACPYTNKQAVEQVSDSSRYFVFRVADGQGHTASIGIGFKQRSEAFNFKVSLQDFENQGSRQAKAEEYLGSLPSQDYSIPQGQSIHVKLAVPPTTTAAKPKKTKKKKKKEEGGVLLSQPPEASKTRQPKSAAGRAKASTSFPSTSTPAESAPKASAPKAAAAKPLPPGELDLFGLGDLSISDKPAKPSVKAASEWDDF